MKKARFLLFLVALCFSMSTAAFAANPFVDVSEADYYYDAVMWAKDAGITGGVTETTFEPTSTCTRGQVVTFLWRANGKPEPETQTNPFKDINESNYFYKAVLWAVEKGITGGVTSDTFAPYQHCSRAHTLTFLWRAEGEPKVSGESLWAKQYEGKYYYEAMKWAEHNGMIRGAIFEFDPGDACPRADIVSYMYEALSGAKVETGSSPAQVERIVLKDITIMGGEPTKIPMTIYPEGASIDGLVWEVDDEYSGSLVVSPEGMVTVIYVDIHDPEKEVTCTAPNGVTASCKIVVKPSVFITLDGDICGYNDGIYQEVSANVGETLQLGVTFAPEYSGKKTVTWSSSDPDRATVTSKGLVTIKKADTLVVIDVTTDSGATDSVTIRTAEAKPNRGILELPDLPEKVSRYAYKTLANIWKITDMSYSTSTDYRGYTVVDLVVIGEKTYYYKGNDKSVDVDIGYKIYDSDGFVYQSGELDPGSLKVGEKFKTKVSIRLDPANTYRFEFIPDYTKN